MQRAFSLVELSIVLVILGLLTGGILAGQSLIRAAELRSVSADLQRHQAAFMTFRDKYFALPGDMPNATRFWGAAHATPATCRTTSSTTATTCDGDGNGIIYSMDGGTTLSEYFHAWKHLANAGLIEGTYTGVTGAGSTFDCEPGTNCPRGKLSNSAYSMGYVGVVGSGDTTFFEGTYGNLFWAGGNTIGDASGTIFRPEEMWNIDVKLDDGKPAYGKLRSVESFTGCNTTTVAATAEYTLTSTTQACAIMYIF